MMQYSNRDEFSFKLQSRVPEMQKAYASGFLNGSIFFSQKC
jgi:hypothetical protein